jgi:hypothetical protein
MKPTISKDGAIRANLSISFRLSLTDMVVLYLRYQAPVSNSLESLAKETLKKPKREIIATVKNAIQSDGVIHSSYWVSDNLSDEWVAKMSEVFSKKFPEMLPTPAQQKAIEQFNLKGKDL